MRLVNVLPTLMDIRVFLRGSFFELPVCGVCGEDKVYELIQWSAVLSWRKRFMGVLTCPVEDCPPSFIHHPGKTASYEYIL